MRLLSMLICPLDKIPLIVKGDSGYCSKCGTIYKKIEGIWKLCSQAKESDVAQWFDQRAQTIDNDQILRGGSDKGYEKLFEKDLEQIQNLLNLKNVSFLLDIGCGNGLFLDRYAPLVKEAVGTDISFNMLKQAKKHLKSKNVLLVQMNSLLLPFEPQTFDAILCNWVLHYMKRKEIPRFLAELARVGKPGVRIFLGEIPIMMSLRSWEAKVGHCLLKKLRIKVSDQYMSGVETVRFNPREIENVARQVGLHIKSQGIMRHLLPSLLIPGIGPLIPYRIQYIFSKFDYKKSLPLIGNSYFFLLTGSGK